MKFLITENKLEGIITKYLDNKNFTIEKTHEFYRFYEIDYYDKSKHYLAILVNKNTMTCYVNIRLSEEIESIFSMGGFDIRRLLQKYVEKTLGVELEGLPGYRNFAIIVR